MNRNQRTDTPWRVRGVCGAGGTTVEDRKLSGHVRLQLVNDPTEIAVRITVRGERADTFRTVTSQPDPYASVDKLHAWAERQAREYLRELRDIADGALRALGEE